MTIHPPRQKEINMVVSIANKQSYRTGSKWLVSGKKWNHGTDLTCFHKYRLNMGNTLQTSPDPPVC
jgi:hypothetical protein